MLLYDIPLIKQSLSVKCVGGLFTKSRSHESFDNKTQIWLPKNNWEMLIAKTSSFQLYKYKKSSKTQKLQMKYYLTTEVYGQICNIQTCTAKISQSKQYIDIVVVTLNNGEVVVYCYSKQKKQFTCVYRDVIFKNKQPNKCLDNVRNVGNYIACSQQSHFLVSSVRCHKRLYQVHATQYQGKIRVNIKPQDIHFQHNHVCWNVVWMPSMNTENQFLGKYLSIQKPMVTLQNYHHRQNNAMIDERYEKQSNSNFKTIRYYYVQKSYKFNQKQQKRQAYKRLHDSSHMIIPVSSSSYFVLHQNSISLRQLSGQVVKQQIIQTQFPIRQSLVDKNIRCMFSNYSRQALQPNKWRIYLINQFSDLFKLQYVLTGNLVANFLMRYSNSIKTVNSLIYVGQVQNWLINLGDSEPAKVKFQTASVLLLGLERFSASLYFLFPSKTVQTKPKQTKVAVRSTGKNKAQKIYPQYSDMQSFKPISQRSRDLQLSDQIQHMGTIVDLKVANLRSSIQESKDKNKQQNNEIFALTNSGNLRHQQHIDQTIQNIQLHKSYLKIIKKGLKIKQINSINYQKVNQIFTFKKSQKQTIHKIVILCLPGKTTVLTLHNQNLTYYKQLSFQDSATSFYIGKLQDESYVQIVNNKLRHVKKQKGSSKEHSMKNKIVGAVALGKHIFLALLGGQIHYYQLQRQRQTLQLRRQFYVNDQIVAMQLPPTEQIKSEGMLSRRISKFLIVATKNYEILIYKIVPKNQKQLIIELFLTQNLKSPIQSIASTIVTSEQVMGSNSQKTYFIFVGMENGNFIKLEYDRNMKKIGQKSFNLGTKPVKIKRTSIGARRQQSLLISSERCYIYYLHKGKYILSLLAYPNIQIAAEMKLSQNPNSIMTYGDGSLRMLSIQTLGQQFHEQKVDLFFSGKKLITFESYVGIIEADPSYEKAYRNKGRIQTDVDAQSNIIQIQNLQKNWKSHFTIYKVKDGKKVSAIYFDQNKQICLCAAYNSIRSGNQKGNYLIFGCAQGISYYPKLQTKQQTIKIYNWVTIQKKQNQKETQYKNQFLYSLNIDAIPLVMEPFFKGQKFIAGVGKSLRLYEIGKKKLLIKAEIKNLPSNVNQIKTIGKKIFVTSVSDSYHLFKYIPQQHTFYDIAQDYLPKFITAMNVLDSETVCAGDKFGNLFIGRLTENAKTQFQNVSATSKPTNTGHLFKFNTLASINIGDVVTSINKVCLFTSKTQVILYSTVMGQIRVLYPLTQYEQVRLIPLLQQKISQKYNIKPVQGNNWGASTRIIKGDYVQKYLTLNQEEQKNIIKDLKIINEDDLQNLRELIEGIRNKII